MSIEIVAKIICDGCGAAIVGPTLTRTTGLNRSYDFAKEEAMRQGWTRNPRYGLPKHFCQLCSDGKKGVPMSIAAPADYSNRNWERDF